MRPPAHVAPASGLDYVKGRVILCLPHGHGGERLVHHHSSLLYRPTVAQQSADDLRILRHFVQSDQLLDWAFISIWDRAYRQQEDYCPLILPPHPFARLVKPYMMRYLVSIIHIILI